MQNILQAVFPDSSVQAGHVFDVDVSFLPRQLSIGPASGSGPVTAKDDVMPGVPMCRIAGLIWAGPGGAQVIADAVRRWTAASYGEITGSLAVARLRFGITVYRNASGLGGPSPVFKVERIELPAAAVPIWERLQDAFRRLSGASAGAPCRRNPKERSSSGRSRS